MQELIANIVQDKKSCIFVSPHLDDAIFSAGSLINYLADKVPVTIVTVFTEASDGPLTLSGRMFLKQSGYWTAKQLFADRRAEDIKVCHQIGVQAVHLGFTDALFRSRNHSQIMEFLPELWHNYPTYRFHVIKGQVSPHDADLAKLIKQRLDELVASQPDSVVFTCAGVGRHVDHVIAHDVCQQFSNVVYWLDYPYSELNPVSGDFATWPVDAPVKLALMKSYVSQFLPVFGHKALSLPQERFIFSDNLKPVS